jgi:hypothetical protein
VNPCAKAAQVAGQLQVRRRRVREVLGQLRLV